MKANDTAVLALKSYILPSTNYFDNFSEEGIFDFVIVNAPKLIKSLKFFDIDTQVKMDIIYKPHHENEGVMQIRSAQFTNGKLKINSIGRSEEHTSELQSH